MLTGPPGAMIAMSPTVTLKGAIKFSMKKLVTGGGLAQSTYTGPGELLLAPPSIGDITSIRLSGNETWSVGRDAFLACTERVQKDMKSQGIGKAMFSGEGWFQYKITGSGILWITSLGAIIRKDVSPFPIYARESTLPSMYPDSLQSSKILTTPLDERPELGTI